MSDVKLQFEEDIVGLLGEVYHLNSYYLLNKFLKEKSIDQENLAAMNKAPAFFQLTLQSSQSAAIMGLAKLYEPPSRKSKGIFNFLNFVEANHKNIFSNEEHIKEELGRSKDIGHQTIKEHKKILEEVSPSIDNLIAWRDKSYAHNDKKFFNKQKLLSENFPITFSEFENLINIAGEVLNDYQIGYNGNKTVIEVSNVHDVEYVLNALKKKY